MANYFTRHHNDLIEDTLFNKSNKDINMIIMDKSVQENNNFCYAPTGLVGSQSELSRPIKEGMLDLGTKADIESKLMNRHVELNSMDRTNKDYANIATQDPSQCNLVENLMNEDSRFTNPIVNYREMNTAEYNFNPYLFVNYQQVVVDNTLFLPPSRGGDSSRYASKVSRYNLKPKEFATLNPLKNFSEESSGYLPIKAKAVPAYGL
jgi:hypothetical protein